MLFPEQADHDAQAVPLRRVQEPTRRLSIRADAVEAVGRHRREVVRDDVGAVVLAAIRLGAEGIVRDAADVEYLIAEVDELAP
jgi:hypothetical protein